MSDKDIRIPDDKDWLVRRCDSAQHLAIMVMTLEERDDWTVKVVDAENLVVLAERKGKERLDG